MNGLSVLFWGLVLATLLITLRWGAMVGLIVFVFALLLGAVAVSRWAPPTSGASAAAFVLQAQAGLRPPLSVRASALSVR
jgi:hypothetical protein